MMIKPCAKAPKMKARDTMIASRPLVCLRPCIGGLGWQDMVEGKRQGSQGAALSAAPPCSLTSAFRTQRHVWDVCAVFLGQLHNHCFAVTEGGVGERGGCVWGGGGGGEGGGGEGGEICNAMQCSISLVWENGIRFKFTPLRFRLKEKLQTLKKGHNLRYSILKNSDDKIVAVF